MSSPKLWIYNYDFEFELADINRVILHGRHLTPWYYLNRASILLLPFANSEDAIIIQSIPCEQLLSRLEKAIGKMPRLIQLNTGSEESNSLLADFIADKNLSLSCAEYQISPWGWSPLLYSLPPAFTSIDSHRPSFDAVKLTNSKFYSDYIRSNFLPGPYRIASQIIANDGFSLAELENAISDFQEQHSKFYVKNYFGTSGNLSTFCESPPYSRKRLKQWQRWITAEQGILLEAYVKPAEELSIQVDILEDGTILPVTTTQLINAKNGSYVGNILSDSTDALQGKLYSELLPMFSDIAKKGYFGPVGVDLLKSRKSDYKVIEINARLTMGRVAYEWNRKLNDRKVGLFANFFWNKPGKNDLTTLFRNLDTLERSNNCKITIINLVHSKAQQNSLLTIFIAANTKNSAVKTIQAVKPTLFQ